MNVLIKGIDLGNIFRNFFMRKEKIINFLMAFYIPIYESNAKLFLK